MLLRIGSPPESPLDVDYLHLSHVNDVCPVTKPLENTFAVAFCVGFDESWERPLLVFLNTLFVCSRYSV